MGRGSQSKIGHRKLQARLGPTKIEKFKRWLKQNGAELIPATNEFEVLRFRGNEGVGVIYTNNAGTYSFGTKATAAAFECFIAAKPWTGSGIVTKRSGKRDSRKRALHRRDGENCFFCCLPLDGDETIEHLVNVKFGGPDRLENMVLAHSDCNNKAGNLSVMEKIQIREKALQLLALRATA